jgi:rhodanese-related sulfurtransferase
MRMKKEKVMKTRIDNNKRGKFLGLALVVMLSGGLIGCNEGYIGPDGAPLLYYLPPENLLEIVENPDPNIRLIDVRPAEAYQQWHIPTAENFPSSDIANRLDELPKDQCYIVMCETGPRAQAVIVNVLEPNGYRCFMNYGASIRWPYGFVSGPDPGTL